jgi:hypothetical protein
MAAAPLIISGIGAGISAIGQWKAGKKLKEAGIAGREAAESQAELLDLNAGIADIQAKDAMERGAIEEAKFRKGIELTIGSQRAGFAAQGVDVNVGSAVDVQADAAFLGELDAMSIKTNASREAWGYQVQAFDLRKRATITRKEGVNLEKQGVSQQNQARLGAVTSIIGTGGSLLAQRYGYSQAPTSPK